MAHKYKRVRFPLWQYLNQPIFDREQQAVLNPNRFWQLYRVRHLERCMDRVYRPEERLH